MLKRKENIPHCLGPAKKKTLGKKPEKNFK